MAGTGRAGGWRETLLLVAAVFLISSGTMAAVGISWARDLRSPRVVLLGSGNRVSALITAGDARLLIATGNDRTAFANALERARRPTARRIDVLLIAGQTGADLVAPTAIWPDRRVRYAASLGPLPRSPEADAVASDGLPVLPSPREIRLGDDLRVTLDVAETAVGTDDPKPLWRAIVRRGVTTVVILSDGAAATAFPPVSPVAALVIAGPDPIAGWEAIPAPVLAVAGEDRVVTGKQLRQVAGPIFDDERWAIRVHPGEAVPLDFVGDGLEVPREPAQAILATPSIPDSSPV